MNEFLNFCYLPSPLLSHSCYTTHTWVLYIGIVPTTNPTSTAIFKALLTLKTRNALILCPHPRAAKCTIAAARIVRDAAVSAGAPANIISWVESPSMPVSQALMQAPEISLILATGGPAMVKAAYSSGHPSVGVGRSLPELVSVGPCLSIVVFLLLLEETGCQNSQKTACTGMSESAYAMDYVMDRLVIERGERCA